jgi:hypothetical protein
MQLYEYIVYHDHDYLDDQLASQYQHPVFCESNAISTTTHKTILRYMLFNARTHTAVTTWHSTTCPLLEKLTTVLFRPLPQQLQHR